MSTLQVLPYNLSDNMQRNTGIFQYPHLPKDGLHFRLLQLYADEDDDPIRCELFTAERSEWEQQYFAISYVWGEEEHHGHILVNESCLQVRRNLFDFLVAFRRYTRSNQLPWAIVWIDAICIDQQTVAEKNHQVQTMGDIFRDAACVFAWLGQGDARFEQVLRSLNNNEMLDQYGIKCFQELANTNKYWTRLWIVQEVLLARSLLYMYGTVVCRRDQLAFHSRMYLNSLDRLSQLQREESSKDRSLVSLFWTYGCLGCTLDHDRIFALHALATKTQGNNSVAFAVDYGMSKPALLMEVIRTIPDRQHFDFIQTFVFSVRLTPNDIDAECAITWNSMPVEISHPLPEHHEIVWQSKFQVLANSSTSTIRLATAHLLPMSSGLSPKPYSVIEAYPNQDIGLGEVFFLIPANPGFLGEYAEMFTFAFLLRPSRDTKKAENGCEAKSTGRDMTLRGIAIQPYLLEKLVNKAVPEPLLADIVRLQPLVRCLAEAATFSAQCDIQSDYAANIRLPFLPYLCFLAQLRHVVVTLHELPDNWHELPAYNAAASESPD